MIKSTPYLSGFNPKAIKSQWEVVKLIRRDFDYKKGVLEILLSGSVGSSKSILMAHMIVTHCLLYSDAKCLVGRRAMPQLKKTLLQAIRSHVSKDMIAERDYSYNKSSGEIKFLNGAEIIPLTWADKNYEKFRSYEFSCGAIEEVTENDSDDFKDMHTEMIGRIGRINSKNSNVRENFILYATNPESPSHYAYDYFIQGSEKHETRKVVYSLTRDNPFLPDWYIPQLEATYDKKMAQRLLGGKWIYIQTDVIYYEYDQQTHFCLSDTKVNPLYPIILTFDFNIGEGKPMSCAIAQYIDPYYVIIDEVILGGSRTIDVMEEIQGRGYFDMPENPRITIHGDATGKHRDTRNNRSDYDIICSYLDKYERKDRMEIIYELEISTSNPSLRNRHNIVNGRLKNSKGEVNIKIDKRCKKINEGFNKTKLIPGGKYAEDDSKDYQHVTTAIGYMIYRIEKKKSRGRTTVIQF